MKPDESSSAEEIFNDALDLPESERAAFLDRTCGDDEALRREVESLLSSHEEDPQFLYADETGDTHSVHATDSTLSRAPRESGKGTVGERDLGSIGHYRLIRQLGRGGQGSVYLAHDERLRRNVALKVLSIPLALAPDALQRFRREAEVASRLDHPAICTVYEAGDDKGIPYIAMRYVPGTSLAEKLREGRTSSGSGRDAAVASLVPSDSGADESPSEDQDSSTRSSSTTREGIRQILLFFERVAQALHFAHEAGLVHRDIKPGNIMVTPQGLPVVLDFGLVREIAGDEPSLTRSGDLMGTPQYMSPEQIAAGRIPADRTTDIYSLGATLYECLTLGPPFEAASRDALYQRILSTELPNPRLRNRFISRDLALVLTTALERDRNRRYRTALDFAEDLRRVREHEPIRARPVGLTLRLRRWTQRNPALTTGALAIVLLLVGGLVLQAINIGKLRARELILESQAVLEADPWLSLELALEAVERQRNLDSLSQLQTAFAAQYERVRLEHPDFLSNALYSPGGREVLAQCFGNAFLWRIGTGTTGQEATPLARLPHRAQISSIAFHPHERRILTSAPDGVASLWDFEGRLVTSFTHLPEPPPTEARPYAIWEAVFSTDGSRILTCGEDRRGRLWDGETGDVVRDFPGPTVFGRAAFSPSGKHLAFACDEGVVRLHALTPRGWNDGITLEGHEADLQRVLFSPNSELLLSYSGGWLARYPTTRSRAMLWDVETGERLQVLATDPTHFIWTAEFSPDGERILTVDSHGHITLWDLQGRPTSIAHTTKDYRAAAFSPDGRHIAAASAGKGIDVFTTDGYHVTTIRGYRNQVNSITFSPDGTKILGGVADGTARIWEPFADLYPVPARGWIHELRFCHDGSSRLLIGYREGWVLVLDDENRVLSEFRLPDGELLGSAALSGDLLVTKGERLHVWRLNDDGDAELQWSRECSVSGSCAVSSDGSRVFSLRDRQPVVYDRDGNELFTGASGRSPGADRLWNVSFTCSPTDGTFVTAGPKSKRVTIWNPDGSIAAEIEHDDGVHQATYSHDGSILMTACRDGSAYLWTPEGDEVAELDGHEGVVTAIAMSPDGRWIATAAHDNTVRLWDRDGRCRRIYKDVQGKLTFTPDNHHLLCWRREAGVRKWILDPNRLLEKARERSRIFRRRAE